MGALAAYSFFPKKIIYQKPNYYSKEIRRPKTK